MALQFAAAYCAVNAPSCAAIGAALVRAVVATAGFLTGVLLSKKIQDTAESYPDTEVSSGIQSCPGGRPPSKKDCTTAKKLLKEYKRLSKKGFGKGSKKGPSKEEIERLNRLRASGDITSYDLPGSLGREFPGTLRGMRLEDIINLCNRR